MIYFADNGEGSIKVGYSANVEARMADFRTTLPKLQLIGTMEGTREHERTLHRALREYSVGREWFSDCKFVRDTLLSAMTCGVDATPPTRICDYEPTEWDRRAKKLADIVCEGSTSAEIPAIERAHGIPQRTLWNIRYRPSREVSAGEYYSLVRAARVVLDSQARSLALKTEFVADLEYEAAHKDDLMFEIERCITEQIAGSDLASVRAAKALVGQTAKETSVTHTHPKDPPSI